MNWNNERFAINNKFLLLGGSIMIEQCNFTMNSGRVCVSFYNVFPGDEKLFTENTIALWRKKEVAA
jgi:hypothetical protein